MQLTEVEAAQEQAELREPASLRPRARAPKGDWSCSSRAHARSGGGREDGRGAAEVWAGWWWRVCKPGGSECQQGKILELGCALQ